MQRRDGFRAAAAAALFFNIGWRNAMAAATNTLSVERDALDILNRLADRDIPGKVGFDARMRALIETASLTALGDERTIAERFAKALDSGVEPLALREAVMQTMAYSGLARARTALAQLEAACRAAGKALPFESAATVTDANRFERGLAVQKGIFGPAIDAMHKSAKADERFLTVDLLSGYCFGDSYTRSGLSLKERELLTFAAIASLGGCEPQVKAHAAGNLAVGTTRRELIDAIVVMLPYIGFPKSLNALAMVNEAAPAA